MRYRPSRSNYLRIAPPPLGHGRGGVSRDGVEEGGSYPRYSVTRKPEIPPSQRTQEGWSSWILEHRDRRGTLSCLSTWKLSTSYIHGKVRQGSRIRLEFQWAFQGTPKAIVDNNRLGRPRGGTGESSIAGASTSSRASPGFFPRVFFSSLVTLGKPIFFRHSWSTLRTIHALHARCAMASWTLWTYVPMMQLIHQWPNFSMG